MSIVEREADPSHRQSQVGDQASTTIADMTKLYHTGSSQYASAESEIDSDASIDIQLMSLGPSEFAHLHERAK